jgi:hypothetical protein
MADNNSVYHTSNDAVQQALEEAGHYVDDDQFSIPVHRARNGNFNEAVGSRYIVLKTATTGPWAALPTNQRFVIKALSDLVTVKIPQYIAAAANPTGTNTVTYAGLIPAPDRPRTDLYAPVVMHDNAANILGIAKIATNGDLTLSLEAAAFTVTANAGYRGGEIHFHDTN